MDSCICIQLNCFLDSPENCQKRKMTNDLRFPYIPRIHEGLQWALLDLFQYSIHTFAALANFSFSIALSRYSVGCIWIAIIACRVSTPWHPLEKSQNHYSLFINIGFSIICKGFNAFYLESQYGDGNMGTVAEQQMLWKFHKCHIPWLMSH